MQVGLLDYVTQHYKPTEGMQTSTRDDDSFQRSGISAKFKYLFCRCPCFASRNNPHNEDINSDVDDNQSYMSNDNSVNNEDLAIFLENGERPEGKYFCLSMSLVEMYMLLHTSKLTPLMRFVNVSRIYCANSLFSLCLHNYA